MVDSYRIERWKQPYPPNPAAFRYHLGNEGYTVYQWADRAGMTYGPHKHEEEQSHWVVSGSLELSILNVGVFVLGPGDRDFLPAGTYHSARVLGDEPVLYLVGEKQKPVKPQKARRNGPKKKASPKSMEKTKTAKPKKSRKKKTE